MSVDYSSGLARGYIIPGDVFAETNRRLETDSFNLIEELEAQNAIIFVDAYEEEPDYILGYNVIDSLNEGQAIYTSAATLDPNMEARIKHLYYLYFGKNEEPQYISYCSVT